ncbi:hypothetical protein [Marinagarivorans algicola]|uniref:hypothetical protein n=1 Tax=Marinagarivorans algicola TaxID=1513270 RepID=UPI0006B5DBE0|nr:hypothetical protein [Marinagarivorans algicola]
MKKIVTAISLVFCFNSVAAFELKLPAQCDSNWASKTPVQQVAANKISKVYEAAGIDPGRCYGWTNLGSGDIWYDFSRELKIHAIDTAKSNYIGVWPLTRWPYESIEPEIPFRLTDHQLGEMGFGVNAYHSSLGCLDDSPLRYGDIGGDGAAELILFLGNDLVMFSPSYEKTVFMIRYSIADWLSTTETATFNLRPLKNADATAQYQSAMVASSLHPYRLPGYRGYAKIFIGNVDGDVHPDILVWRKLYESHLINNPVQGFTKLKDTFVHYEQDLTAQATLKTGVTGEYLPQKTDSATIKNWLKTSKLTWQKGFPSTSECAGQKGQLIPEMHDVLLNDPEVLQ